MEDKEFACHVTNRFLAEVFHRVPSKVGNGDINSHFLQIKPVSQSFLPCRTGACRQTSEFKTGSIPTYFAHFGYYYVQCSFEIRLYRFMSEIVVINIEIGSVPRQLNIFWEIAPLCGADSDFVLALVLAKIHSTISKQSYIRLITKRIRPLDQIYIFKLLTLVLLRYHFLLPIEIVLMFGKCNLYMQLSRN